MTTTSIRSAESTREAAPAGARRGLQGCALSALKTTSVKLLNEFRSPAQVRLIFEVLPFQVGVALGRRALEAERKPFVPVVDDRIREAARAYFRSA